MATDGEHHHLQWGVGGSANQQPAVRAGGGGGGRINVLPLPEETGASGTSPGSNDGARPPRTSTNNNKRLKITSCPTFTKTQKLTETSGFMDTPLSVYTTVGL